MQESDLTILIPSYTQPNFMAITIRGLVEHSAYKHKIIITGSKYKRRANDFSVEPVTGKRFVKYTSVKDYLSRNKKFLEDNEIEYKDCTQEICDFEKGLKGIDELKAQGNAAEDGVYIAFKNNFGVKLCKTKYILPNWDADFYVSPNWDKGIMAMLHVARNTPKIMVVPVHLQPHYFEKDPNYQNMWQDVKVISTARYAIPSNKKSDGDVYSTKENFFDFINKWSCDKCFVEKPGQRINCHWVPAIYRRNEFNEYFKEYSYKGSCYDLEWDDRFGALGFTKFTPMDSFIIHKGLIPHASHEF